MKFLQNHQYFFENNFTEIFSNYKLFLSVKNNALLAKKPIILYGAGNYGKALSLIFKASGCPVTCFCDNSLQKQKQYLDGLPVYSYQNCLELYGTDCLWVVSTMVLENSLQISQALAADGFTQGKSQWQAVNFITPNFSILETFYLRHTVGEKQVVLTGPVQMCNLVAESMEKAGYRLPFVFGELPQETDLSGLLSCFSICDIKSCKELYADAVYYVCYKPLLCNIKLSDYQISTKNYLLSQGIPAEAIDFSAFLSFLSGADESVDKERDPHINSQRYIDRLEIDNFDKVCFQYSQKGANGNSFFNMVMDDHPNILYLGYNMFTANLLIYIRQARHISKYEIPDRLVDLYEKNARDFFTEEKQLQEEEGRLLSYFHNPVSRKRFKDAFIRAVENRGTLTDRDIFIAVHIAHFYMLGRSYHSNVRPVIYMDAHNNSPIHAFIKDWLTKNFQISVSCTLVRNTLPLAGGLIRRVRQAGTNMGTGKVNWTSLYPTVIQAGLVFAREIPCPLHFTIRFEDLKLFPEKVMKPVCEALEIPWDDSFLRTTDLGQTIEFVLGKRLPVGTNDPNAITGYDIRSVYNYYDEYFNSFDRFRLDLLYRARQAAYGYPTLDKGELYFSAEQLEEWFRMPFRFERFMEFRSDTDYQRYRHEILRESLGILYCIDNREQYPGVFSFEENTLIRI